MEPEGSLPQSHLSATCPYPEPARSSPCPPHPTCWRSISILSSHLRLGLPRGLFPSGIHTKTLYKPLPSPIRATFPAQLILLDFITCTILGEQYRSLSYSLCSFLQSSVTSSLLGPNIILNTLVSNTISLHSSLNVSDQVSHPYKTTSKIIVLYKQSGRQRFCTKQSVHKLFKRWNYTYEPGINYNCYRIYLWRYMGSCISTRVISKFEFSD